MSFYFSLWFSAFLSNGYWEWREQLVFQSLRYSWEKPWSFLWWLPKIVGWKPDGKNENAIQPSAPFLHNFHIKSTWSINCVQHKIALGAEEKMMSPAHSISQGDVGSELPKKSSLANLLGTRASPPKTEQAAVHAQIARRAKHIVTLLERKSTQEVHWQQEPASGYGANTQETSALTVGGSREMATPWGVLRKRERSTYTHAHTCTHGASEGSRFTRGRPTTWRLAWLRTSFAAPSSLSTFSSPFKAQTYLQFQIHLLSSEIHTEQVNLRLVHRSQLVLFGCTLRWGTASDLKQPEGVSLLSTPLWGCGQVYPNTKVGPQERPKWQKHDRDQGRVTLFTWHLTNPNKTAALACQSWLTKEQVEAAMEQL